MPRRPCCSQPARRAPAPGRATTAEGRHERRHADRRPRRRAGQPRLHHDRRCRDPAGAALQRLRGPGQARPGRARSVPLLAESWEVSRGPADLHLRAGRGRDVQQRRAVHRRRREVLASSGCSRTGRSPSSPRWTSSTRSRPPSPTELVVTLTQPSNDWLYRMTTRVGAMFDQTGVDDLANEPVGTGPYDVGEWTRGDSITLSRNDDYWGEAAVLRTTVDAAVLQGRHRAEQRPAQRQHRRHRHRADPGVARAVRGQRRLPGHRGHHERRGRAVDEQRDRPAERPQGCARPSGTRSTTRRWSTPAGPAAAS